MKKNSPFLILYTIFLLMTFLTGCESGTDYIRHNHSYITEITEPTCTSEGFTTYICECGYSYVSDYVEKTDHNYIANIIEPTCEEGGYTIYTCDCGESYIDDYSDELNHNYIEVWQWEDYDSAILKLVCANDENHWVEVDATISSIIVKEPTCTSKGQKMFVAKAIYDEKIYTNIKNETIEKKEHTYLSEIIAPTCEDEGYTFNKCSCGDSYISDYVNPIGHSYKAIWEWNGHEEATCKLVCINDCMHIVENLSAKISILEQKNATCEGTGYIKYIASVTYNSIEYTDEKIAKIEALGHNYKAIWEWNGYEEVTCKLVCINDSNHTIDNLVADVIVETKNATCEESGYIKHIASATYNSIEYTDEKIEEIEALGHKYKYSWQWNGYEQAIYKIVCSNDEAHTTEIIADITIETKNATCEESGYIKYIASVTYNSIEFIDEKIEEIKDLGHNYEKIIVEPTCEEQGHTVHKCSECGDEYVSDYVEALGHNYKDSWTWTGTESAICKLICLNNDEHKVDNLVAEITIERKEATCEEAGYIKHIASVTYDNRLYQDSVEENLNATGHKYEYSWQWNSYEEVILSLTCSNEEAFSMDITANITSEITNATCEENGSIKYTASVTYDFVEFTDEKTEEIKALGHNYEDSWSWTETNSAICKLICLNNNEHIVENLVPDITTETKNATCEEAGYIKYIASVTYNSIEYTDEKTKIIEALGHNYETTIVEPTCEERGYTNHKCSICGDEYIDTYTEAIGHKYKYSWQWNSYDEVMYVLTCSNDESHTTEIIADITTETKNATCEEAGYIKYIASVTYNSIEFTDEKTEEIKALGHNYEDSWSWTETNSAICKLTCSNDETHTTEIIADITIETKNATCEEAGYIKYIASVTYNSIEYTDEKTKIIEALGHNYESTTTVLPTCEEQGYTVYKCSECGDEYTCDYVEALGHEYNATWIWEDYNEPICILACSKDTSHMDELVASVEINTINPTCIEDGLRTYTAKVVLYDKTYTDIMGETLEALGHSYETTIVEPTCEEGGYTNHKCSTCGDEYIDTYTEAIGHNYEYSWQWNGYEQAIYKIVCSNDEAHITEIFADITTETKNATCEEAGYIKHIASVTYNSIEFTDEKIEVIEALGHNYETTIVEPTCEEGGYTNYKCSICGVEYISDYVEALGHNYEGSWNWTGTESAICKLICLNNNEHIVDNLVADITTETKNATCEEAGYIKYIASVTYNSIEYINETTKVIEALGHNYESTTTVLPTCEEQGYTVHRCSECSDENISDYVEALGHEIEYGICNVCDYICPSDFNNTYGYEFLTTKDSAEEFISFYNDIDTLVSSYHQNYQDISSSSTLGILNYSSYGITKDEAGYVWKMYRLDHPLYYWFYYGYSYTSTSLYLKAHTEFLLGETRKEYDTLFIDFIRQYLNELPENESVYMKALYFTDLITGLVDYKYDDAGEPASTGYAHSIAGILDETGVVCEGYAMMFNLLLNIAGVENIYVVGSNHAFNMLRLDDGNWYWYDLTWDDNSSWELGCRYTYFCVNDTQEVGNNGYLWVYNEKTFMTAHEPYQYEELNIGASYQLPERSTVEFTSSELLINDVFTKGDFSYFVCGYNKVMLCESTATGVVTIDSSVTYGGRTYDVVGICGIKEGLHYPKAVFAEGTTKVIIPQSIKYIADFAFNCETLENISVNENNEKFTSEDGILFTKSKVTLIKYPSAKADIESYTVPTEVVDIAKDAFADCDYLNEVIISKNVLNIGVYHYGYNYRDDTLSSVRCYLYEIALISLIVDVDISEDNTAFKEINEIIYDYDLTILYYCNVKNKNATIEIEETVTTISSYAFTYAIANVVILPTSITTIQNYAFYSATIYSGINYLGDSTAFSNISIGSYSYITRFTIYYTES